MNEIYLPSDDSYFFADFLRTYLKGKRRIRFLDIGGGSGILSETASEFVSRENILATDTNPDAVKFMTEKGINAIESDLFDKVNGKFDLIVFNAPYLPKNSDEPKDSQVATTGGENGDEVAVRFLKQAKKHLNTDGKIFLLISSLTPTGRIKKFGGDIVARKKIFFEELLILEFG